MEVSSPYVAPPAAEPLPAARPTWRSRLRTWLRPANWSAAAEPGRIPRGVHVLLWLWLLGLDALKLSGVVAALPRLPNTFSEWQPLLAMMGRLLLEDVCGATLFYLVWRWLIPRTLGRARVVLYVALAVALVLPYAALLGWVASRISYQDAKTKVARMMQPAATPKKPAATTPIKKNQEAAAAKPGTDKIELWMLMLGHLIIGTFIVASSSALRITGDYIRGQRNRRELERQQLLTELAMLKTQINPHFLFNTLNNIYSLTSRKSDKAPEAVLRLSEIMRYLLYESSTDMVPLSRELAHLHSFLDLQRLRLPATAQEAIRLDVEGTDPDCAYPVAPLLLLPLVENAFKHGDLSARPVAVHIRLLLAADGLLRFSVLNHVPPADPTRQLPAQPGGVGLVNLRRRLELLYPNRYSLEVHATPAQHLVTLVLLQ
ncbi:sensor histidine kinase [Hymenobacter weizhouensis]|uniref:sensor histidine kinase n=1 Tax=Hymenobacter sp. YIM 151500-1 TaxID=2987689 RepID=UPI00222659D0|nr:sensor histidine kinase [Hymenobacter sp. YIM 151500-1]UYZ62830.1 sensor histidine kinase [Hymenobacter sp. YIM 151500-1]